MVIAEVLPGRRFERPRLRVVERLGDYRDARSATVLAIAQHNIRDAFAPEVLADAAQLRPAPLDHRVDRRTLPIVTIDGADARDFDDAVHVEADDDPGNPGGHRITVAIADVAWYVRPETPLDVEARLRGNSVYFPDRAVPMLPERLSNNLCSLRPDEDRPVLAVAMTIDARGRLKQHCFERAMIRSAARLTYEQVQAYRDGASASLPSALDPERIAALYRAFEALATARRERGALDIEREEQAIDLDAAGRVIRIAPRPRLDAHRLIEEMMILANVAAAETLERHRTPLLYRVHDRPSPERLEALRATLETLGYRLARGQPVNAKRLLGILAWSNDKPCKPAVHDAVLRAQALAVYAPRNLGHFGLALGRYAHFTSPIRRYADLQVHRALIAACHLGPGGAAVGIAGLERLGESVSATERAAQAAERSAADRIVALHLAASRGAEFEARVTGRAAFGIFAELAGLGAQGLIPVASLDAATRDALRAPSEHRKETLPAVGTPISVRLASVDLASGALRLEWLRDRATPARESAMRRPRGAKPRRA
jgi:ribonuclease R